MRKALFVFGVALIAIGGLQSAFQSVTINITRSITEMELVMRLLGLVAMLFGVLLLIAAWRRLIGLRQVMTVLGWVSLAAGALIVLVPSAWRELTYSLLLNAGSGTQSFVLSLSGLIRIVIGIMILYGLSKPPRVEQPGP